MSESLNFIVTCNCFRCYSWLLTTSTVSIRFDSLPSDSLFAVMNTYLFSMHRLWALVPCRFCFRQKTAIVEQMFCCSSYAVQIRTGADRSSAHEWMSHEESNPSRFASRESIEHAHSNSNSNSNSRIRVLPCIRLIIEAQIILLFPNCNMNDEQQHKKQLKIIPQKSLQPQQNATDQIDR